MESFEQFVAVATEVDGLIVAHDEEVMLAGHYPNLALVDHHGQFQLATDTLP